MKPTTAVAISGGVDSLMAACLLKEQGHQVIGIHFITGYESAASWARQSGAENQHRILDIGKQLSIPVEIVDISSEFQDKVVDYFIRTYQHGQTPNPCMRCNPTIKFGTILSFARRLGAQKLATGHYAIIKKDRSGRYHLFKGHDRQKDQSYFLARLSGEQLADAIFPLGKLQKAEVKQMALQRGLQPVTRSESQDVCFIKNNSYGKFLSAQNGFISEPGKIEDMCGKVIGQHNGLHLFTIGQRRGINCPAAEPYYVIRLDIDRNRLIVGSKKDLLTSDFNITEINWIGEAPDSPTGLHVRMRYRSQEVAATVVPLDSNTAQVRFKEPQPSVTPGQGAVFYRGEEILGGGFICPRN
jgi:tRNA-specific 2-thiouridylase